VSAESLHHYDSGQDEDDLDQGSSGEDFSEQIHVMLPRQFEKSTISFIRARSFGASDSNFHRLPEVHGD
jgi:hypothetical protein